jgi:tetratricopeptide (TPR) repeat protein
LEDFVKLAPLVRYERTLRDYVFLNTLEDGEAEYLSYRSGDFDFQHASSDWRGFFGIAPAVPEVAVEPEPVPPTVPMEVTPPPGAVPRVEPEPPAPEVIIPVPPAKPSGPSIRDLVAAFVDLGKRTVPPDWGVILDQWETTLSPLSDDTLTQLFAEMQAAVKADSSSESLLLFLGNLEQRLGFHEQAVDQFKVLSKNAPDNKDLKSRYGCALLLWGNQVKADGKAKHDTTVIRKAKEILGEAIGQLEGSLHPPPLERAQVWPNVRALIMLADACCRRGEFERAAKFCDEGLKLERDNQRLKRQRAFIYETSGL